jgi:hypothetical protein
VARLPEYLSTFDAAPKLTDEDIALIDEAGAKEYHRQFVRCVTSPPRLHVIHSYDPSRRAFILRKDEDRLSAVTVQVQLTIVVNRRGVG